MRQYKNKKPKTFGYTYFLIEKMVRKCEMDLCTGFPPSREWQEKCGNDKRSAETTREVRKRQEKYKNNKKSTEIIRKVR